MSLSGSAYFIVPLVWSFSSLSSQGWLPNESNHFQELVVKSIDSAKQQPQKQKSDLHTSIQNLWDLIDSNESMSKAFALMAQKVGLLESTNHYSIESGIRHTAIIAIG
jgi:hypothetical protein